MSFLNRMFGRENRSETVSSSDPYLGEFFGQRGSAGGFVDDNRASGQPTAHACISVITQSLASVPLNLYRRAENGGREKAIDHPLYTVLHDQANPNMTAFEAIEFMIAALLVKGNAYARIVWNGRGQVTALYPLDPANVSVEKLRGGMLRYRVSDPKGGVSVYLKEEILHLRYRLGRDGIMGLSPIQITREATNLALQQQDTAYGQASKSHRPEGALVFPNPIGDKVRTTALDALRKKVADNSTTGGVMVLDGGVSWQSFAFSSRDAEFLESRKLANLDICRIWGVPPTVVGILDHGTYSNVEMESRALVTRCLAPLAKRLEQAMAVALLPPLSRKSLFIEHDLAGLMRGDLKARYEAYRIGREWGWLSPDEIRGWENMPAIEGGNEYLSPLNMVPLGDREAKEGQE